MGTISIVLAAIDDDDTKSHTLVSSTTTNDLKIFSLKAHVYKVAYFLILLPRISELVPVHDYSSLQRRTSFGATMWTTTASALLGAFLVLAAMQGHTAASEAPLLEVSGFSWVENIVFDGHGNLWASEATLGQLWRVHLTEDGSAWNKTLVLEGFRHVDGLAVTDDGTTLYAIAQWHNQSHAGEALVVSVQTDTLAVNDYSVVAVTPELPNGMKRNLVTGKLYLTVEGPEFLPTQGKAYEVDIESGKVTVILKDFFWSDGIAMDHPQQLLYIGELMTGKIYMYNMSSGEAQGFFHDGLDADQLQWLDDFFVDNDCTSIVGAGYSEGVLVRFQAGVDTHPNATVLATGLTNPTAVLWGPLGDESAAAGFRSTSLYVTEGGGFTDKVVNRRIVEVPNMRAAPPAETKCWNYRVGLG